MGLLIHARDQAFICYVVKTNKQTKKQFFFFFIHFYTGNTQKQATRFLPILWELNSGMLNFGACAALLFFHH